jgi:periplasmic divalent cation tolerance protein
MIIILATLHKKEDAVVIGKGLLQERLIACYNLFPIESAYWWKGEMLEESETLLFLKTKKSNFDKIEAFIKQHSGYEVPEVISIAPDQVNDSYLQWVESETR